jgi:L-2,4-diaminobutyrate decarboxylase
LFESEFLMPQNRSAYLDAMRAAAEVIYDSLPNRPYTGLTADQLAQSFQRDFLPPDGASAGAVLNKVSYLIQHSVMVTHPYTAAHFHCPPLIPAVAAESIIAALNQSMDSFDQAPAATVLETEMIRWLCERVELPVGAGGVFTSGGTQSNFMGLMLARDNCVQTHWSWSVGERGLPAAASRIRILCSDIAHFSIQKSAAQLGLGAEAVRTIPTDSSRRLCARSLRVELAKLREEELYCMAVVATAGSTDFGSVDPLSEIAGICRSTRTWFHVDAAYGAALLFSPGYRQMLHGIENADSIGLDFHKLLWQPISCSAFLLRDADQFRHMELHADYLNPVDHADRGIPNLVTKSIATTRRFDSLKLWVSLQVLGEKKLGEMIDRTFALAQHVAEMIRRNQRLELLQAPSLGCVLFRYLPTNNEDVNRVNGRLRQRLFDRGIAIIGQTKFQERQYLKLTCMNPAVMEQQYEELLAEIVRQGSEIEANVAANG